MAKKILFQIDIEGSEVAIKNATDLKLAIAEIDKQLKQTSDDNAYQALEQDLLKLKAELKEVNAENQRTIRDFQADKTGEGSYQRLSNQLTELRRQFRELSREERESDIGKALVENIRQLDTELKAIDASIGQFQRNVGNYPRDINVAFGSIAPALNQAIPGFNQLNDASILFNQGLNQLGQTATATGKILAASFIGFQLVGLITDGVQAINQYTQEVTNLRGEIQQLGADSEQQIDDATSRILSLGATFGKTNQELLVSANAVAKAYGITIPEALDKIEAGFLAGADVQGEFLDTLREYPRQFQQLGFSLDQFIAIQAKAQQEGVFSDKGVDAVKEFGIRIREQTTATQKALSDAFGAGFADELAAGINSGEITVAEALARVSSKLNDTQLPAKQLQQVITDVFGGPGEDAGDEFIKSLADIDQGLNANIDTGNQLLANYREQLEAERQLADAKIAVTKAINDLTGGTKTFGQQAQAFGINVFVKLLEAAKPLTETITALTNEFTGYLTRLGILSEEGSKAAQITELIGKGFSAIFNALNFTNKVWLEFIRLLNRTIDSSPALQSFLANVQTTISDIFQIIEDAPRYYAGATAAARQWFVNTANYYRSLLVEAEILFKRLQVLNPFNDDDNQLNAQITALEGQKDRLRNAGKSIAEAFKEGFDSVERPALSVSDTSQPQGSPTSPRNKPPGDPEAVKEQRRRIEAARKEALEAERQFFDEQLALLDELSAQYADAVVDSVADRYDRQIAAEKLQFERQRDQLRANLEQQIADQQATREQLVAAFGAGSQQVAEFERQAGERIEAIREQYRSLSEIQEQEHQRRIEAIRNEAANNSASLEAQRVKQVLAARTEAFNIAIAQERIAAAEQINQVLRSDLPEDLKNEVLVRIKFGADIDSLVQQRNLILDEIETIESRISEISDGEAAAVNLDEYQALTAQLDALYLQRAENERAYTEVVKQESDRRFSIRNEEYQNSLQTLNQVVSLAEGFFNAAAERDLELLRTQEEERAASIERIQSQLEKASGSEKAILEKKLQSEVEAQKKLEAQRRQIEQEGNRRAKAFAIVQSIIQTALNVVKALGTGPVVPNVAAAALATALGAAQTAVIAAQPAAEGGKMGAKIPNQKPGLVVIGQNIPTLSNGDNVLATLKRGEVVLNKRQQRLLGGAPTFRAIGVPGFAEGGAAGAIISAPDVTGISNAERVRLLERLAEQQTEAITAINNRIDRMKVYVVAEEVLEENNNAATIKAAATLE